MLSATILLNQESHSMDHHKKFQLNLNKNSTSFIQETEKIPRAKYRPSYPVVNVLNTGPPD